MKLNARGVFHRRAVFRQRSVLGVQFHRKCHYRLRSSGGQEESGRNCKNSGCTLLLNSTRPYCGQNGVPPLCRLGRLVHRPSAHADGFAGLVTGTTRCGNVSTTVFALVAGLLLNFQETFPECQCGHLVSSSPAGRSSPGLCRRSWPHWFACLCTPEPHVLRVLSDDPALVRVRDGSCPSRLVEPARGLPRDDTAGRSDRSFPRGSAKKYAKSR